MRESTGVGEVVREPDCVIQKFGLTVSDCSIRFCLNVLPTTDECSGSKGRSTVLPDTYNHTRMLLDSHHSHIPTTTFFSTTLFFPTSLARCTIPLPNSNLAWSEYLKHRDRVTTLVPTLLSQSPSLQHVAFSYPGHSWHKQDNHSKTLLICCIL